MSEPDDVLSEPLVVLDGDDEPDRLDEGCEVPPRALRRRSTTCCSLALAERLRRADPVSDARLDRAVLDPSEDASGDLLEEAVRRDEPTSSLGDILASFPGRALTKFVEPDVFEPKVPMSMPTDGLNGRELHIRPP